MTERQKISPHPLDGCNDEDCYRTMMAERTVLIAAQREAQDTLIKTIIQLSSALIALMAGFITQAKFALTDTNLFFFSAAVLSFAASIVFGLMENFFGSKAYKEQQVMLEDYYGKYIGEFAEAKWNKWVHRAQLGAFLFFVIALLSLAIFGLLEAKGKSDVKQSTVTTSSSSSPTTTTTISTIQRGNIREQPSNQVSSSDNATSSAEKEMIEARLTSPCCKPYFAHNYCYCAPNSCSTISLTPREPANFKRFSSGCKWRDRQTNPTVQERTGRSAIILRPHPRTHGELAARRRPVAAGDDRRCRLDD